MMRAGFAIVAIFACISPTTSVDYPPNADKPEQTPPAPVSSAPSSDLATTIAELDRAAEPIAQAIEENPKPKQRTRVLIISQDGMRPDALDAEHAPNHMVLMREGMTARRATTVKPSETLASHASMLSGF